ncbi:uncharacterized protein ACLA_004460 [Aspergillus clavatus NRRL 1]|uniref:DUF636 domain protein n=1 Tax=Aspergillus clavatus (strain ATCC 1007 / CBS 513.65 / DSM 816 / NCTC 3887 / NRRL 1 / QM 1276 / 107) TaxID=344612 RepID=A1C5R4_ASPCL|nr:DUF636 domain protein [Aspergillus clavatus NRRL 1]EAW15032.1 DUF636 domain protein [Aspergillus clavatus NRRL 1]
MAKSFEKSCLPYRGSCHCGCIQYIAIIPLPPAVALGSDQPVSSRARFYKCNCSTCQKMGYFHLRLPDAANQFFVLSPSDLGLLGDYRCQSGRVQWLFCPKCGVRCFAVAGPWKQDTIDRELVDMALPKNGDDEANPVSVWRMDPALYQERVTGYVSLNALTIDQDQAHGTTLDLRELVDRKWVEYLDCKERKEENRYTYPQEKGTW